MILNVDSCGTSTPRGTSAGDSPVVSACQTASGVTGAKSRLGAAAPACWTSAAEPWSHLPRHGERCQVTPVPLSAASVPSGPNLRVISAHSSSAPATLQATSSQMCTTAPGDGSVRNIA